MATRSTRTPLVARQMKKSKSVVECLALLPDEPTTDVLLAALQVCGKHSDLATALKLLRDHKDHSEACITSTISIAGKCGDYKTAMKLLNESPTKSVASYHTALAACGKAKAWRECLQLYNQLPPSNRYASTLPGNICLTAMANAKRGKEAQVFFETHMVPHKHDLQSVLKTMTALIAARDLDNAHAVMLKYGSADDSATLMDRLTSAYARANNWAMVEQLNSQSSSGAISFQPWKVLPKLGKGRAAHWKLGTYVDAHNNLIVALQPHRNPTRNGIKLLLMDGETKIGYLLMKNTDTESSLLGAFLDPNQRQRGLSKVFLAVWMQLCLDAGITAVTGVMNKPLLCLTLQHTFGYEPSSSSAEGAGAAVSVEISPSKGDGKIVIYSPTGKSVAGAFSPADKKREALVIVNTPPEPRGRTVIVKSALRPPKDLADKVKCTLDKGTFQYNKEISIKSVLCGG